MQTRRNFKASVEKSKPIGIQPQHIQSKGLVDDREETNLPTPTPGTSSAKSLRDSPAHPLKQKPTSQPHATTEAETGAEYVRRRAAEHHLLTLGFSPETLSTLTPQQKQDFEGTYTSEQFNKLMDLGNRASELMHRVGSDVVMDAIAKLYPPGNQRNPIPPSQLLDLLEGLVQERTSSSIGPPEVEAHGPTMVEQDEKVLVQDGVRYRPLPLAAQLGQAPRQTLLNWIKNKTEFAGRPLQSYYLAPVDRYFVSEESIQRIANRFVRWPSQEEAGLVTLGETKDKSGFLTMSDAARIIGISPRTMWLWASQGKAPTNKPLDVVRCTTSDHFYIREKNVHELKKLVPKSGLQRGRRTQTAPHL